MNRRILIALFLAVLVVNTGAPISSQKAVNFVSLENDFLFEGENTEIFPNVQIRRGSESYWVVSILSGDTISTLIPLKGDSIPQIPVLESENRVLIKTGYVLRSYQLLKENLVQQNQWIFTTSTENDLRGLVDQLRDERFDLQTSRVQLVDYPEIQGGIDLVLEDVDELRLALEATAVSIDGMREIESAYFRKPDTNSLSDLQDSFEQTVGDTAISRQLFTNYLSELDLVQQAVAQTDLTIDTKTSLQNLLAPDNQPVRLQTITTTARNGEFFIEELQKIFDTATAQRENLLANLKTRVEKNNAFSVLFGTDAELIERTNGAYTNVEEAVEDIFSEDKQPFWKEQNEVIELRENWKKAESFYRNGDYTLAEQHGDRSQRSIIRIFKTGFAEIEQETGPNTTLLVNGIIILVILLIVVYVARNRGKLLGIVSQNDDEYE
jgi:hypothetical protein